MKEGKKKKQIAIHLPNFGVLLLCSCQYRNHSENALKANFLLYQFF